jgi:hypothetical protein
LENDFTVPIRYRQPYHKHYKINYRFVNCFHDDLIFSILNILLNTSVALIILGNKKYSPSGYLVQKQVKAQGLDKYIKKLTAVAFYQAILVCPS